MRKNYLNILIIILLFFGGCNRSQEAAFIDLKTAFIGWYLKANPIISEEFNQLENVDGWRDYSKENMDEYFSDIQRFFIELSQIDRSKLSDNLEFEYLILWSFLKNTIYLEDTLNPLQWDLKLWTVKLNYGLENINLECGTLTAREESILKSRLYNMENLFFKITDHLKAPQNISTKDGVFQLEMLQNRILTFLVECESDSNIYERWNKTITSTYNKISTLITNVNSINQFETPQIEKEIWEKGYEVYFGQFLDELISIEEINNEIDLTVKKMLNISLPIYLKNYDEPIWVSKQDTIQVLQTVFKSFKEYDLQSSEIVKYSENVLENLKYQFKNNYFSNLKFPKFEFSIGDSSIYFNSQYQSSFSNSYRAKFYIPQLDDSINVINSTFLEYYLINEIFPGKLNLLVQNSKSSDLVKLLQDNQFIEGWVLYIQDLLLGSKIAKSNPKVALLMLENKLLEIQKLKAQIGYFNSGNNNINDILIFSETAKYNLINHWMTPVPNMNYIVFKEIIDLKQTYLEQEDNDLNNFNEFISKNGSNYIYTRQNLIDN